MPAMRSFISVAVVATALFIQAIMAAPHLQQQEDGVLEARGLDGLVRGFGEEGAGLSRFGGSSYSGSKGYGLSLSESSRPRFRRSDPSRTMSGKGWTKKDQLEWAAKERERARKEAEERAKRKEKEAETSDDPIKTWLERNEAIRRQRERS